MGKSLDRCSTFQLKTCSRGRRLPKDRFSSLPDDILLFIMSFLTCEEVVKTSILSRRWLNLWKHTLVIHFHTVVRKDFRTVVQKDSLINDRKRQKYVKRVNRVLRRHKGQYLKEFKIVCELDKRHQKDIDNWLLSALAKKVQCLELNFLLEGLKPSNLDNIYVFLDPFLNLGCGKANSNGGKSQFLQSDFKCLNSLSLKRVAVTDEAINFVLLNCPFLERLEVVGSVKLANLIISDPTLVLKYLKITHCFKLEVFTISNFNLVSLDISAVRGLTLTNLPMLVELFISGSCVELSHSISQASSCFSQLEAFKLSGFDLKDITQLSNYSQLTKLKRLVIDVKAKGDDLTKLISIANYCPRLEEFVLMLHWFQVPRGFGGRFGRTISEVERHNSSLKSRSLKVFEFVGYSGDAADVKLIMHVVENAVSLEKIIIDPCDVIHIGRFTLRTRVEEEVRRIVLQQFDSLRESIPPHINLILR